ncbi:MAG: SpoIIE family protein phosphatase, partial [Oscillospiraceae bacterium]|nr:SpoIIE family protein phosphatase [Oscillospiraceae bacterium]
MKRHASGLKALLWIWGILAVLYLACGVWIAWAVYTERPLASVLDPAILPVLTAGCMVVAALALSIGVLYLRGRVLIPLKRLHELVEYWPDSSPELLRKEAEGILGAPGDTAKILIQRIEQMEEKLKKLRAGEEAAAANRDVLSQYETLLRSAVPCHLLPELSPEGSAILAGIAEPEGVAAGILYDRFSVGTDRVCVIIGEASGVGADAVFHAGLAHGILRCLLTAGRPLNETMTVMNTWLMEREDRFTLRVMAGALNLRDGRFDFVNAGGRLPLLRRKGEQYEWMEPYACSVLGVNRNA